ncbi:hypothetical protein RI129_000516 [Pyrocoelia pectoralis]|uniref:Neugrin n=1 Tax=Pyrocoelia pectoralis TaxID=417401 RepID=A0AAN7ZQP1_9COLE
MYFAKNLLTHYHVMILKEIRRNLPRRDPGIYHRKKLIENDDESIDLSDYDYDLESDFMNIGSSYKDHLQDINKEKENVKKCIIKQKYFKEDNVNFLTWNDKEQIRYLHSMDPEEWTIEKLSEGFPALPHIVAKIVKPRLWEKKTVQKVQNHDKSVIRNWELFKTNKLTNLSSEIIEHLTKFTNRALNLSTSNVHQMQQTKKNTTNVKVRSEFSDIITSYNKLKKNNVEETPKENSCKPFPNKVLQDTYVLNNPDKPNKHDKHITLQQLQNKIVKKSLSGSILPDEEELLRETKREIEKNDIIVTEKQSFEITTINASKSIATKRKSTKDYLLEYPEKITIPKGKVKPGCTYKLNDCYYDDDGLFLYRVPGMYK